MGYHILQYLQIKLIKFFVGIHICHVNIARKVIVSQRQLVHVSVYFNRSIVSGKKVSSPIGFRFRFVAAGVPYCKKFPSFQSTRESLLVTDRTKKPSSTSIPCYAMLLDQNLRPSSTPMKPVKHMPRTP